MNRVCGRWIAGQEMFKCSQSGLEGCFEIQPVVRDDPRGRFVKTWNAPAFSSIGINDVFLEHYYSVSKKGVLRGLHFQTPPHAGAKLVFCTDGDVLDVVVDIRKSSPTFGRHATFSLSALKANMIYVPVGFAHGFLVVSDSATLVYNTTATYAPDHDNGILWNSADVDWPVGNPVLSDRDRGFPPLSAFQSPF